MDKIRIVEGAEITEDFMRQALALDKAVYPDAFHLSADAGKEYYKKNPDIYTLLADGDVLVGYINFSPVTSQAYHRLRSGKESDVFITADDIQAYQSGNIYDAYLSSVVIREEYRGRGYGSMLLSRMVERLCDKAKQRIYIRRIVAEVLSQLGGVLAEKLGLHKISDGILGSDIYELVLLPFDGNVTVLNSELINLYSKHIKEENI